MDLSDSELSDSDRELQESFARGELKPGLNQVALAPKEYVNNTKALKQKLKGIKLKLPWIETLESVNAQAPLAPELAAKMLVEEQKRETQLKNNKKLPQYAPSNDPVLNDFKREMMFYRQAQATVAESIPKLHSMGIPTKRPDDYFVEMAKTDAHMQKIREQLMQKEQQQKRSERVKQLRQQRKEGKMLQVQNKLQRQQEKKEMLDQVKKYRKGLSKEIDFLDNKKLNNSISRKSLEKRKFKNKKFGFGGKKKGSKINTKESANDISEYRKPKRDANIKGGMKKRKNTKNARPGKNRRMKIKAKK